MSRQCFGALLLLLCLTAESMAFCGLGLQPRVLPYSNTKHCPKARAQLKTHHFAVRRPALEPLMMSSETQEDKFVFVSTTDEYEEIEECAQFFVSSFWERGTSLGELELDPAVKSLLLKEQQNDMSSRYGKLLGNRKLSSSLFLARDDSGAIEGCCGVEIAVADRESNEVLSREQGEQLLLGGIANLGGRQRNELRKQPLVTVAATVLPSTKGLIPVLSNLAVREDTRGRGVGKTLCRRCEDIVKQWGFKEILLLVEEQNTAARQLYTKLGYQEVFTKTIESVRPAKATSGDGLLTEPVSTVGMAKALS